MNTVFMCIEYAPDVMSKSISAPFGDYSKGGWQIVLFFEAPVFWKYSSTLGFTLRHCEVFGGCSQKHRNSDTHPRVL